MSCASSTLPCEENGDGIDTARTDDGPSASAASVATNPESIPPDRPITVSRKPFLTT